MDLKVVIVDFMLSKNPKLNDSMCQIIQIANFGHLPIRKSFATALPEAYTTP